MKHTVSLRPAMIRILVAVVLIALSVGLLIYRSSRQNPPEQQYDVQVVPPTCTDNGYSLYTGREDGSTYVDDIVQAPGHSFGQWVSDGADQPVQASSRSRSCTVCGTQEQEWVYPQLPIPVLALEGSLTGIGKKQEVEMFAGFYSQERTFTSEATLKYQGHESLAFDKKNYTLKFWEDAEHSDKNKMTFSHWNAESKYILKANYIDPSGCRNLICADVWAAMTASREQLPEEFHSLSNYGAVDGFPVALYINGQYQGLYNMNLHKDDDLFAMSEGAEHAILITNEDTQPEANFRGNSAFREDSAWEVEYCGTENRGWAQDKLNELITFVQQSDDETFRRDLGKYLDVGSAIDYLLSTYALGLTNHGASDLVLVCYDRDDPWTASMYDMETAFGLGADGLSAASPEEFLPYESNGIWASGTDNLLWDRLIANFYPEMCQRYAQLRQQILATQTLQGMVTDITGSIPADIYTENDALYPGFPTASESIEQIRQYITHRTPYMDEIFQWEEGTKS